MKKVTVLISLIIFFAASLSSSMVAKNDPVFKKFEKFWKEFQKLVEEGNKEKLSTMVSFGDENPYWNFYDDEKLVQNPMRSKNDFFKKFSRIFTPDMKAMVKKLKAKDFITSDEDG